MEVVSGRVGKGFGRHPTHLGQCRRRVDDKGRLVALAALVVLVALVSLVITSIVGLQRGSDLADTLLRSKLTSIGAARADEVQTMCDSG